MLVEPKVIYDDLKKAFENHISNSKWQQEIMKSVEEKHNIPGREIFDYLIMKIDIENANEEILYALVESVLDNVDFVYTEIEKKRLATFVYKPHTITMPIRIEAVQITENQWLGGIGLKQICEWGDDKLIMYNPETQRPMVFKNKNGFIYSKISINPKAVDEIEESFLAGTFESNVLTFNLSETADFWYDKDNKELVIEYTDNLDILDGYHRYVAARRIHAKDRTWDYPMGIQIVYWTQEKARHFIFQEDQKTKMTPVQSQSFNQYNYGNRVVSLLNTGILYNFEKVINKEKLSVIINKVYFPDARKKCNGSDLSQIKKQILTAFEAFVEKDAALLDNIWSDDRIYVTLCLISKNECDIDIVNKVIERCKKYTLDIYKKGGQTNINRIFEEYEEVRRYV